MRTNRGSVRTRDGHRRRDRVRLAPPRYAGRRPRDARQRHARFGGNRTRENAACRRRAWRGAGSLRARRAGHAAGTGRAAGSVPRHPVRQRPRRARARRGARRRSRAGALGRLRAAKTFRDGFRTTSRSSSPTPRKPSCARAPRGAFVVVTTHSHALDFTLIEAALARDDWRYVGLIGSKSKRAQFERRLAARGHAADALARVAVPDRHRGAIRGQAPGRDRDRHRRGAARCGKRASLAGMRMASREAPTERSLHRFRKTERCPG